MSLSYESKRNLYKCSEKGCDASYTKACRLEVHQRKHTGERPFVCDVDDCTKAFTNPAHLKRHKSLVHEKSSEISCTVEGCGRIFNNKYSLKKHISRCHNVITSYKCMHCSQEFKKKGVLKQHVLLHKGEDPFKCSLCNISFGSLHLYSKHKSNHKTYTCDCGVTFNRWSQFCQHRKTSCSVKKIDHKCVICNKIFTTASNLKTHSITHLEESQKETYYCPYLDCKRSYSYKKNLKSHITLFHEGQNDLFKIKCTEEGCSTVLKSKKNLRQHLLNVHNLPKKRKDRKPRKDKGRRKKCMASVLSGIPLPLEEHLTLLNSSKLNKEENISKMALSPKNVLTDQDEQQKPLNKADNESTLINEITFKKFLKLEDKRHL